MRIITIITNIQKGRPALAFIHTTLIYYNKTNINNHFIITKNYQ